MKVPILSRLKYALDAMTLREIFATICTAPLWLYASYINNGINALTEWKINFYYVGIPVTVFYLLIFLYHFFSASLAIENKKLKEGRGVVKNINDSDLQKLLRGYIVEDRFIYQAEITPCKFFDDKISVESLKRNYTLIPVRCPAGGTAYIRFSINFSRIFLGKTCLIWIKDGTGREFSINVMDIYKDWPISVDSNSNFHVKLEYNDTNAMPDGASFRIEINSWSI